MRDDRLALYTTVYPGVEPHLAEWYRSVEAQTDAGFDLWVGADMLSESDVAAAIGREPRAQWIAAGQHATPARIRTTALAQLVERYPAVVLVDSDDVLHPTRVSAARAMLERADLAACALDVMDGAGRDLGIVFEPPADVAPGDLLPRWNVFGLSNTAYRSATLGRCLPVPDDCVLIDWLLATRAWSNGATIEFDTTPRMRYRQYHANLAPVLPPFDERQIATATARVLAHYEYLLDDDKPVPPPYRPAIEAARARVLDFDAGMQRPGVLEEYVNRINRLPPGRVWWWHVADARLEELWSS